MRVLFAFGVALQADEPLCSTARSPPLCLQGPHASLAVRLTQRDSGRSFVLVSGIQQQLLSFSGHS